MEIKTWKAGICAGTLLFSSLASESAAAGTYYVATSGNDANDGESLATAWRTLMYAAATATAGDTVYIKAGLYVDDPLYVRNSGTEAAPIVFQGYETTPGDTPDPQYVPGEPLDSSVLPVLEAVSTEMQDTKTGINVDKRSYVELRHLAMVRYDTGISFGGSDHLMAENVYAVGPDSAVPDANQYLGIWSYDCHHVVVRNCVVADAEMHNISFRQTHDSVIESCHSFAKAYDPGAFATDYHIVLADGHNNVVRSCVAENLHSEHTEAHPGHGIGIKDTERNNSYGQPHSYNNKFIDCEAYNMGEHFWVSHEAYNNEFVNCFGKAHFRDQNSWNQGIDIRDGAHDNVFRNCRMEGMREAIAIQDTVEGLVDASNNPIPQICSGNLIVNSVFVDANRGISLWNADNNVFENCVFDGAGEWTFVRFPYERVDQGNVCRNSIITNVSGGFQLSDFSTGAQIVFTYSDFWTNSFAMPAGGGNLTQDPLFADAANGDYHLKSQQGRWDPATSRWVKDSVTSPCIDAGDPSSSVSSEPCLHGDRINMGAYGGTAEASQGALTDSCACENGATRSCYTGRAGTAGVGACKSGEQSCVAQVWGSCDGQVTPTTEICGDTVDNDCDGGVDEEEECPGPACDGAGCHEENPGGDTSDGGTPVGDEDKLAPGGESLALEGQCGCRAQGSQPGSMGGLAMVLGLLARRLFGALVTRQLVHGARGESRR